MKSSETACALKLSAIFIFKIFLFQKNMSVLIPSKVITDLSKFDAGEFEDPKWIIMKNNAGLQLQMFWPNKSDEILSENNNTATSGSPSTFLDRNGRTPLYNQKKRRRKRSPQRVVSEEDRRYYLMDFSLFGSLKEDMHFFISGYYSQIKELIGKT